ncbi:MAG: inositol monophosphatase family protein [Planctomycetota bacterium]
MNEILGTNRARAAVRLRSLEAQVAISAAMDGASALLHFFRKDVEIQIKGTANFVSTADLAAETAIVERIRLDFPHHAIISEETHSDRADAEHLWIIDPLDGTSNYLHGMPHFAVSIGYYRNGVGEVGVVCDPAHGDWYVAARDQGAWRNGEPMRVSSATQLSEGMIACGFYYDRGLMMESTLATIADLFRCNIHGIRRCGAAALDLAYVASGWFDGFFEYRLSPWDYAAGQVLLVEAGGAISDCAGAELPLGRPSSVCASNGTLHQPMLQQIEPHWKRFAVST